MRIVCMGFAALAAAVFFMASGNNFAGDKAKPKYTIEEVMEKAHKGGAKSLRARALKGKASAEELKLLVELYTAMCQGTPPKGDVKEWRAHCTKIVNAAKKLASGEKKAAKQLARLTNCGACHKKFKK